MKIYKFKGKPEQYTIIESSYQLEVILEDIKTKERKSYFHLVKELLEEVEQ